MFKAQPGNGGSLLNYYTANLDPAHEELLSFTGLPVGWHYGQGRPISWPVVSKAMSAVSGLRALGARLIEVFPSINGAVLISAFGEDACVDLTVTESPLVSYVVERDDLEVAAGDGLAPADFWQQIEEERWLGCISSDLSIRGTIATRNVGLPHWRSLTPTEREYQWCANAA